MLPSTNRQAVAMCRGRGRGLLRLSIPDGGVKVRRLDGHVDFHRWDLTNIVEVVHEPHTAVFLFAFEMRCAFFEEGGDALERVGGFDQAGLGVGDFVE